MPIVNYYEVNKGHFRSFINNESWRHPNYDVIIYFEVDTENSRILIKLMSWIQLRVVWLFSPNSRNIWYTLTLMTHKNDSFLALNACYRKIARCENKFERLNFRSGSRIDLRPDLKSILRHFSAWELKCCSRVNLSKLAFWRGSTRTLPVRTNLTRPESFSIWHPYNQPQKFNIWG